MTMLEFALEYRKRGFSIIPIRAREKRPAISSWQQYQQRLPDEQEIDSWFKDADHGIGIVTGQISNLVVVDLDSDQASAYAQKEHFPETPAVKTPKGFHLYYRYKDGVRNSVRAGGIELDIRGDGGYVVAPPSLHEAGHSYEWVEGYGLQDLPVAAFPSIQSAKEQNE